MNLTDAISRRKTIKLFDDKVNIPREVLSEMLCLAQLAPSKANLQPWRFVVVDDPNQKNKLSGLVEFNELPCKTASVVILILADLHYDQLLGDILDQSVEHGYLASTTRDNTFRFFKDIIQAETAQETRDHILIDCSLASMQLMLVAKDKGYDTHAIGIFNREAVLNALEVDATRYLPVMLLAIGKAATEALPSCRLPLAYTVAWNNGQSFKK